MRLLTIVTQLDNQSAQSFASNQSRLLARVGEHVGLAGHAIVDFPGGGRLLTACPHWVELSQLEAEEQTVLTVGVAEDRYGKAFADDLRARFNSMGSDVAGRKALANQSACRFVQQSNAAKWVLSTRGGESKLETCKRSLLKDIFPTRLGPQDNVGLLVFGNAIRASTPLASWATDRSRVESALASASSGGGTNMWFTIDKAIKMMKASSKSSKWIVALTDGASSPNLRARRGCQAMATAAQSMCCSSR